jgi:hypothetical protein
MGGNRGKREKKHIRMLGFPDGPQKKRNVEIALFDVMLLVPKGRLELPPPYGD